MLLCPKMTNFLRIVIIASFLFPFVSLFSILCSDVSLLPCFVVSLFCCVFVSLFCCVFVLLRAIVLFCAKPLAVLYRVCCLLLFLSAYSFFLAFLLSLYIVFSLFFSRIASMCCQQKVIQKLLCRLIASLLRLIAILLSPSENRVFARNSIIYSEFCILTSLYFNESLQINVLCFLYFTLPSSLLTLPSSLFDSSLFTFHSSLNITLCSWCPYRW